MFDVKHEDDAWELGVLKACGFFDSPGGSQSAEALGVPADLASFFNAGMHDHKNLADVRIEQFANQWGVN